MTGMQSQPEIGDRLIADRSAQALRLLSDLRNNSLEDSRNNTSKQAKRKTAPHESIADPIPAGGRKKESASEKHRLVILVHGIRTRAEWESRIRYLLEQNAKIEVVPIGYGYFDVFRFLFPIGTRRHPVHEVLYKIRDTLQQHSNEDIEIIFVGHSFGTYILATILRENPDIRPQRILLCGSIVSRKYRWDQLPNRPTAVLNEAGSRDVWPILAKSATWGYGSTGTFGFQTPGVRDRYHDLAHSDYFKSGFAEKYWVPWILHGIVEPTSYETNDRPPTRGFMNLLELVQLKYLFCFILAFLIVFFGLKEIRSRLTGPNPTLAKIQEAIAELPKVHRFVAEAQQRYETYRSQPTWSDDQQRKYAGDTLQMQNERYAQNAKFSSLLAFLPREQSAAIRDSFNRYLSAVEGLMRFLAESSKALPQNAAPLQSGELTDSGLFAESIASLNAEIELQYKQTMDILETCARSIENEKP